MTDEKVGRDYDCDLPFSSLRISFESSRSITWYWRSPVWADTMRSHFLAFSEVLMVISCSAVVLIGVYVYNHKVARFKERGNKKK